MQDTIESETNDYLDLLKEIEEKKHEYKLARRSLIWYRNILLSSLFIAITAIILVGILGKNTYYSGLCEFIVVMCGFILLGSVIFFFLDLSGETHGERVGFRGLSRIIDLIRLKDEIERQETLLRIREKYQAAKLSPEEQYALYKGNLIQVIQQYQRGANRNRRAYYRLQMTIFFCSLLVTGLTSGLTNLITPSWRPWFPVTFSLLVSFLTAIVILFKPREKGYHLQQTADAIEFEIACANRHIFNYKGLPDREAYTRLAEEVEKLRHEQRKRQQQLEQASEVKQPTE